ncbi:hypothetical protein BCR35DRAFT_356139 [Leucosporidium creatinivorum]|uniref:Small ribosomal subunit protein mS41 n=1 Tax=Leucosporidium creatinivorum TaxID=106004 RepID=A0A1Y2CRZ9_9BASI|nr:hypothetical protein BCR35DRAFT_356139 [Leucosporidium creatinivorum]
MSFLSLGCSCLRTAPAAPFRLLTRTIHAPASQPLKIPQPRGQYTTPLSLLSSSKRGLEQYEHKLGTWDELFSKTSAQLAEAGMTVGEKRYLLWLLERYRRGHDPSLVAIPPTPKKKIRGWGPKVQFGKRVR